MNDSIMYGILHPTKGLLGRNKAAFFYPNEKEPEKINLVNTSLQADKDIQLICLKESTLLQTEGCKVVPVILSYRIGEVLENE